MGNNKKSGRHKPTGLEILYEDPDVIVINKEAGVLSCPTRHRERFTAENTLTTYLRKGSELSRKRAYLVHRLDRDTSGVMVFAKSRDAWEALKKDWNSTEKLYLAAVRGHVEKARGEMRSYVVEDFDLLVRSVEDPEEEGGCLAVTRYAVIGEAHGVSMVKVKLLTGRKNQIRVHFAESGHPVVGDVKYSPSEVYKQRLCLHAKTLAFNHPRTGKRMEFDAGIPPQFLRLARGFSEKDWEETRI